MSEQKPEYVTDALEMMGVVKPKKIIQEISGFVPVFDVVVSFYEDHITALVFGRRWQYCRMEDGVCRASLSRLAKDLRLDEATIMRHTEKLVKDGYLVDLTPDRRNRPHVYADAGRVVMKSYLGVAECNTSIAQSNVGIAQSQLIKQDYTKNKDSVLSQKDIEQANRMVDSIIGQTTSPELRAEAEAINAFESAFGIERPWNWYPAKTSEEKTWRDFRAYVVEKYEEDHECFTKYVTWRNQKYSKGTMSNLAIKRNPEDFPDSWVMYQASEAMYGKKESEMTRLL